MAVIYRYKNIWIALGSSYMQVSKLIGMIRYVLSRNLGKIRASSRSKEPIAVGLKMKAKNI